MSANAFIERLLYIRLFCNHYSGPRIVKIYCLNNFFAYDMSFNNFLFDYFLKLLFKISKYVYVVSIKCNLTPSLLFRHKQ